MAKSRSAPEDAGTMEERSTRSRIIQAALRQFAELGFKGATIRGIASDAGVSAGLVQHHFPTKDALREACDEHVFEVSRSFLDQGIGGGAINDPAFVAAQFQSVMPLIRYLSTSLASGSPMASRWFDEVADFAHEVLISGKVGPALPETEDTRAIAAVHTAMRLGLTIMYEHLVRALDMRPDDPEALLRIARAGMFIMSDRILGEDNAVQIHKGLDHYEAFLRAEGHATGEDVECDQE